MAAEAEHEAASPAVAPAPSTDARAPDSPKSYLVLLNVGKRQNSLLRSACAFGVSEVLSVGAKKLALFGSQGTASNAPIRNFESLEAVKQHLSARGASLCGVEITDDAQPIQSHPFRGPTAFMLSNEGCGMTPAQKVYIPHSGATASLNVAIAGSIVLHHFAIWAGMSEHPRSGEKYVVANRGAWDRYQNPTEFERAEMERKKLAEEDDACFGDPTGEDADPEDAGADIGDVDTGGHSLDYDGAEDDFECRIGNHIWDPAGQAFTIVEFLGQGTFGRVVRCFDSATNQSFALKVVKRDPLYFRQALKEVAILDSLNHRYDVNGDRNIVRMLDFFVFRRHLCISFQLLHINLYEMLKEKQFVGVSLHIVSVITKQLLKALECLREAGVIHGDLKPENVVLVGSDDPDTSQTEAIPSTTRYIASCTCLDYLQHRS